MSKPTKATKHIHERAERFKRSCSVDWDSGLETVTISSDGEDDIFMQGEEADNFIREVESLCTRYRSLDEYTAACCLAMPYVECIWN